MPEDVIFEPLKEYNSLYKDQIVEKAKERLSELIEKTHVDCEKNKELVKKYHEEDDLSKSIDKQAKKKRNLKNFIIVISIIMYVIGTIFLFVGISNEEKLALGICVFVFLIAIATFLLILNKKKIIKKLKNLEEESAIHDKKASEYKSQAYDTVASLLSMFDWSDPIDVIKRTCPILQIDNEFDVRKFYCMKEKYNYIENDNNKSSTLHLLSGMISGNPFFYNREFNEITIEQPYTGQLTIHWTVKEKDANGNIRTVTKTQTLTATILKPAPKYYVSTELIYANEAAPKLKFSRVESGTAGKSEKEINKIVEKGAHKIKKLEEKALKKGDDFVEMNNAEFDVLFGATNRNNEVEFRLLFTPLAQSNMVNVLRNQEPFGDDFKFRKDGCLNFISSSHSQNNDIYCDPSKYYSFDLEEIKTLFVDYTSKLFRDIYFDMVPLLSIPLYQMHKPVDYIYDENYLNNFSKIEHESAANSFDPTILKHHSAITSAINKEISSTHMKDADEVKIRSYAYRGEERIEYVPKLGGDGRTHNVPVHWIEYIPAIKDSNIILTKIHTTRYNYISKPKTKLASVSKHYVLQPGYLVFTKDSDITDSDIEDIKKEIEEEN